MEMRANDYVSQKNLPEPGMTPEQWIAEEKLIETHFGIDVPTREEMKEIEASNRLYEDNGALYMTATVAAKLCRTALQTVRGSRRVSRRVIIVFWFFLYRLFR